MLGRKAETQCGRTVAFGLMCGILAGLWLVAMPGRAAAEDRAGEFDYYVLALSWNAAWCASEGDARDAPQCDPREDIGFVLHGLWPQHEDGWPEYCQRAVRDPNRAETGRQADLFGSGGLAWHQWKKHGRCSGLEASDYFALAREAWRRVERPALLRQLDRPVRLKPEIIEQAFLEANPDLSPDGVTVTCADGMIREVRLCLARDLTPRVCTGSAARQCTRTADFVPMR